MSITDRILEDNRILKTINDLEVYMDKDDIELLVALLKQNRGSELDVLHDLMNYTYNEIPVDMETFLLDERYLGLKGQLYPTIVEDLCELFEGGYDEAVLAGGIGWGKSTFAECSLVRMVYEVSCFRNPQAVYNLAEGTMIAFVNVSLNITHAEEVVFHGVKTKLLNSPYFTNKFPYDKNLKTALQFPNNIVIQPTINPIGYNVFGGVLDEVNFMSLIENSKVARGGKYDQAQSLRDNLIRRMKSRFMKKGKLPGILLSVSSSRYPDDFTERMFEKAKTDSSIFCRRYSQWGTKPKNFYIGEVFHVCLGDGQGSDPKICEDKEEAKELKNKGYSVIEVPVEYKQDFLTDLDGSIRDLAGYPTLTISPFIRHREKIFDAIERGKELGLQHPFSRKETTLQDGGSFIIENLRRHKYPCFIHNDLALTGDSAGFCMGHVEGYRRVTRRNEEGELYTVLEPNIVIDLMLKITAPKDGEIILGDVRALIFELRSYGYNIRKVTYDQFQSADSRQQMKSKGIESERISADGNPEVYNALRDALYEDRLYMYDYDFIVNELVRLEKNEQTGKVDHPVGGSKDIADALAGVCYLCAKEKPSVIVDPVKGMVTGHSPTTGRPTFSSKDKSEETERKEVPERDILDRYLDNLDDMY